MWWPSRHGGYSRIHVKFELELCILSACKGISLILKRWSLEKASMTFFRMWNDFQLHSHAQRLSSRTASERFARILVYPVADTHLHVLYSVQPCLHLTFIFQDHRVNVSGQCHTSLTLKSASKVKWTEGGKPVIPYLMLTHSFCYSSAVTSPRFG